LAALAKDANVIAYSRRVTIYVYGLGVWSILQAMVERQTEGRSKEDTQSYRTTCPAVPYTVMEDRPEFKKDPEALKRLCACPGQTFTHPKSGLLMVYDENYVFEHGMVAQQSKSETRTIEGNRTIKPKAQPKRAALANGKGKILPKAIVSKMNKALEDYASVIFDTNITLAVAESAEAATYVPEHMVQSVKSNRDKIIEYTNEIKTDLATNSFDAKTKLESAVAECEKLRTTLSSDVLLLDGHPTPNNCT
jgi:hypothetical protein